MTRKTNDMKKFNSKFKKGDKVDYYDNNATIKKVSFNVFDKSFDYSISYIENNIKKGQTAVKSYEFN